MVGHGKRKFSFSSLRLKIAPPAAQVVRPDYEDDSPPYSPTPSCMERPSLHPQVMFDLRQACAILVNETTPPDPDDEPDHHETMRRYEAERKAQARSAPRNEEVPASEKPKARKEQPPKISLRQPVEETDEATPKLAQYSHVPKHAATTFSATAGHPRPLQTYSANPESIESTYPDVHSNRRSRPREPDDPALRHIRDSLHARPKTSAAACVDYNGPADSSSKSTSRSVTDYDARGPATSTGVTSVAMTPGEEKAMSHDMQPSDDSYQDGSFSEEVKAWRAHQEARRRAEEYAKSGRAARPGSRASKLSRMASRDNLDRPPSRAGSIASSIGNSISNYWRPRPSMYSTRSGQSSALSLSRSESRRSSMSGRSNMSRRSNGWWRNGGLRRRGSWASFRSGRPGRDNDAKEGRDGEPNLNRPLPALPGLDQYREAKTHIGQLMKSGGGQRRVKKGAISVPQPLVYPQQYRVDDVAQRLAQRSALPSNVVSHPPVAPMYTFANPRAESPTSISSRKWQKESTQPPMIRGPSYQREVDGGVYPRPMEVSGAMYTRSVTSPSVTVMDLPQPTGASGAWEKRGGLKGRMGRIFGGKDKNMLSDDVARVVTAN